jgi:hypothetical protein
VLVASDKSEFQLALRPPTNQCVCRPSCSSSTFLPTGADVGIESIARRGSVQLAKDEKRAFPGLLIQGDTLSTLLDHLEEELPDGHATRTVRDWLMAYEEMMSAAGIRLPYRR